MIYVRDYANPVPDSGCRRRDRTDDSEGRAVKVFLEGASRPICGVVTRVGRDTLTLACCDRPGARRGFPSVAVIARCHIAAVVWES